MTSHYNPGLVFGSLLISVLACWMALELSCRVQAQRSGRAKLFWLSAGACVMGLGIWAMHYLGMLAYRVDVPVFYHWPTVLLSLLAAIAASLLALYLVSRPTMPLLNLCGGALCMGTGIAAMHYIGMAAMRMQCTYHYNPWLVALSVLLAVGISVVALRLCFWTKHDAGWWSKKKMASALLMGFAVPSMHYVGMAAMQMEPMKSAAMQAVRYPNSIQLSELGSSAILGSVFLCLCFFLLLASLNRDRLMMESKLESANIERDTVTGYQQRLMQAYRQNGVGAWEWDPETDCFAIDPSLRTIYDIDASEGDHTPRLFLLQRMYPEDLPLLAERWNAALTNGTRYENEYRILHRNGRMRRCRSVATVARDKDGTVTSVFGMSWDVTAEWEQQQDYAAQAKRFYVTLEAIGDAVLSIDADHRIRYANPVACALTGWPANECIGRHLTEVFVAEDEDTGVIRRDCVDRCAELGGSLMSEDGVLLNRQGKRFNIRKHVNLVDERGGAVITFQDITSARQLERKLQHAATYDNLTGLPNRAAFESRLKQVWDREREENRLHCLAILDLDRFKLVNDTAGHLAGDALLREVIQGITPQLLDGDMLGRMGGDEFLLLLRDTTPERAEAWSKRLLDMIEKLKFVWQDRTYSVTASMGMVFFDHTTPSLDELTSQADVALYTSKRNGRNQFSTFLRATGEAADHMHDMEVVTQLRSALEEDRFELHAQPIVPLDALEERSYFELLIRMRDSRGELVSPGTFIPAAECYGMMHLIDRWVVKQALKLYSNIGASDRGLRFAINISAESLSDASLWNYVSEQFQHSGIAPSLITFEVTESGLIRSMDTAKGFLAQAKSAGCRIALDDFGTGMSSLSYLKQFPLNVIKIDGSFVRKLLATPLDQSIVKAISEIAHSMGASTVAECAEDMKTVELLTVLGVDYVQGWATGRPEPLTGVLERAARPVPKPSVTQPPTRDLASHLFDLGFLRAEPA